MKIIFVLTGSLKKSLLKEGFDEYIKRIRRYSAIEVLEIKESPMGKKAGARHKGLLEEAGRIKRRLSGLGTMKIALTEKKSGRAFTSSGLAAFIEKKRDKGQDLAFIIGGPYGLDAGLVQEADMRLSLSPMTLPHEMAALLLAEQVYRAFTILRGEPYSH